MRPVFFLLSSFWKERQEILTEKLRREGWECSGRLRAEALPWAVVFTDDPAEAVHAASLGGVCVGCAGADSAFFEGAALVTEQPEELTARQLERLWRHEKGVPALIAKTKRLTLRELVKEDWKFLRTLELEEPAAQILGKEDSLQAYCACQYRLFDYGLWLAQLHDQTPIGCCGLVSRSFSQKEEAGEHLELQYALARAYQKQGYAQEMARAATAYAAAETDFKELWVCIRKENQPSLALAGRLGFQNPPAPVEAADWAEQVSPRFHYLCRKL